MEEISVIGIDLAKSVFEMCAISKTGETVWTKRLKRTAFERFIETQAPRCVIGMEACAGAHHWGRRFEALGFTVKLMAPRPVQAYRQGVHKNDARDARAIAEAASRSHVAPVRVKSEGAQLVQALVRVRTRRLRQLVQTANQLRGILNEYGVIAPKGRRKLLACLDALAATNAVPAGLAPLAAELRAEMLAQEKAAAAAGASLCAHVKADETCVRLMTVPGIGPINAATLSVALAAPQDFGQGRAFAAHLGLVPRQSSSAGKERKAGIVKQTANDTRVHLVLAAQSLITAAKRRKTPPDDPLYAFALNIAARKHRNVAAVAVAAKLSRIAWAVAAGGGVYAPPPAAR